MSRTIEDSKKECDVVFISFGKEKGKEIKVVEAGEKDSFIIESMEIKVGNCSLDDMKFSKEQKAKLFENRKARRTRKAVAKSASQR